MLDTHARIMTRALARSHQPAYAARWSPDKGMWPDERQAQRTRQPSFRMEGTMAESNLPAESGPLAIATLVTTRCRKLGLSKARLVRLAGYRNEAKGLRRLDALLVGDTEPAHILIQALPIALGLPTGIITAAVEETQQQLATLRRQAAERAEAEYRATFRPHAVILTERTIPQPMFIAAVIGAERLLRVEFEPSVKPVHFVKLALHGVNQRLAEWRHPLPGYGRPTGIIVNYSPDCGVRFDLEGTPRETFDEAYRIGQVQLLLKGRPVPPLVSQVLAQTAG